MWDHRDANGHIGAAACIVIPAFNEGQTHLDTWQDLAWWIDNNLPYHRLTFFKHDNTFNIGWHEKPRQEIYSWIEKPRWVKNSDSLI